MVKRIWNIGKQSVFPVLMAALVLLSCKKDDDGGGSYLPVKISAGGQPYMSFEYDAQNRFTKATYTEEGDKWSLELSYPEGKVYVIQCTPYWTEEAVRSGNTVTVTRAHRTAAESYTETYTLSGERPVSMQRGTNTYTYTYDNAGNLTKEEVNGQTTDTYEYDDQKGAFSNVNAPVWLIWMLTDGLEELRGHVNNVVQVNDWGRVKYTYNSAGYPTSFGGYSITYK